MEFNLKTSCIDLGEVTIGRFPGKRKALFSLKDHLIE